MLRMDRYPYSRFWAIWDDQDLVAVVVYKKGATELLRRLQVTRRHPHPLEPLCQQRPPLPCALESAGPGPARAAWLRDNTRPGSQRRTAKRLPCRASPWTGQTHRRILPGRGPA